MLGDAYLWGLKHLAWAMYDEVFVPGNKLALSFYNDWDHVVAGTLVHLIFWGQTDKEHCEPTTVASFNVKWATELVQQQRLCNTERGGLHCHSRVCMQFSHYAVKGDSATTDHVLPLYRRSPGHGTGPCSRF